MILQMFVTFDSKAEAYLPPFFVQSRGQALRSFEDTVNDTSTLLNKHPGDFTLFHAGTYDDQKGIVTSERHSNLGKAIEFLNKEPDHPIPLTALNAG